MLIKLLRSKLFFLPITAFLALSCDKDNPYGVQQATVMTPLTGDTSVMVGKWNWIYSDHAYGWCLGDSYNEVVDPSTEGFTFSIRFIEEGLVYFYKNDSLFAEHSIVFREFLNNSNSCETSEGRKYYIYLDAKEEKWMSGCIDYDTIMRASFVGFFLHEQMGCGSYSNFFVKE
jgi:hypothetical protein